MSDRRSRSLTVSRHQALALPPRHRRQLARQRDRMQYIAAVAEVAMDELSKNYEYAESKIDKSLAAAAQIRRESARGRTSPKEEAAFQKDTELFLDRMVEVVEVAGYQIRKEQERIG